MENLKLEKHIKTVMNQIFPNVPSYEKKYFSGYLLVILNYIYIKFAFDKYEIFEKQLTMNKYKDIKAIILLLFPYVESINNFEKFKELKSFQDIIEKEKSGDKEKKWNNYYKFSNFQLDIAYIKLKNNSNEYEFSNYTNFQVILINTVSIFIYSINTICYKLYPNYLNIFPLGIQKYKNTKLYKNSFKFKDNEEEEEDYDDVINKKKKIIKKINWFNYKRIDDPEFPDEMNGRNILDEDMFHYNGITVDDIYNVFVNFYYLSIKSYKFLIFEFKNEYRESKHKIYDKYDKNIRIPYLYYLDNILFKDKLVKKLIEKKQWDYLSNLEQIELINLWKNINIEKYENQILICNLILNFEYRFVKIIKENNIKNYKTLADDKTLVDELKKGKKLEEKENDDDSDNVEEKIRDFFKDSNNKNYFNKKYIKLIIENKKEVILSEIEFFKYIYEYLLILINKITYTPYYHLIFNNKNELKKLYKDKEEEDKEEEDKEEEDKEEDYDDFINKKKKNTYITLKNYYNFGKSLYINTGEEGKDVNIKSNLWIGLTNKEKDTICSNLNDINDNWFNITNVLGNIYDNDNKIKEYNKIIYQYIRSNLIDITFKTLARFGLLSEFKYNNKLTNESIITEDLDSQLIIIKKELASYLKEPNDIIKDKNNKDYYLGCNYYVTNKKYPEKYFDDIILKNKYNGYITYTMNWVTQLDFYNKFLNNRVILVTGATGQGKSVHVPKLIYYGSKMINFNTKAKTIVTQPRIPPVVGNSDFISQELGVNILNKIKGFKNSVYTEDAYVQITHAALKHTSIFNDYFLRNSTDGLLLQELINNILMKKKIIINKKTEEYEYLMENIYDIVVIDESHEHNSNMDLILSLMKYSMLFNTSLKLFIVSATMEKDEPIYRRYYRCIDDNLSYPINQFFKEQTIYKNFLDRRFNIEPPGNSLVTRYKIDEFYLEKDPIDFKESVNLGINKVYEILGSSSVGELLFFVTTSKECRDTANIINQNTSSDIVALPYYSRMNSIYKNYLGELEMYKDKINFNKDIIVDIFADNYEPTESELKQNNKYKRLILIATNVAEASITIPNLKFVIDTGYFFDVIFNYDTNTNDMGPKMITESSRLQRRGRVGRKEAGTVYHMYTKGSREDVISSYDICTSDITDNIYKILYESYLSLPLFNKCNYYHDLNINDLDINDLNFKEEEQYYKYLPEYKSIFKKQFTYNDKKIFFPEPIVLINYNLIHYEFKKYYQIYLNGFDINNIIDNEGLFYIIHPCENLLRRNLKTGQIIQDKEVIKDIFRETKDYKVKKFKKIDTIILNLQTKCILIQFQNPKKIKYNGHLISKTNINNLLSSLSKDIKSIDYDMSLSLIFIYSILYKCTEKIIIIISFIITCDKKLKSLYERNGYKLNLKFKDLYKNYDGDIFAFLKIFEYFKNLIFDPDKLVKTENNSIQNYIHTFNSFKNILYNNETNINITEKEYIEFMKNKREGKDNLVTNTKKHIYTTLTDKIDELKDNINFINFCKMYCINKQTIINMLIKYIQIKKEFSEFKEADKEKENSFQDKLRKYLVVTKSNNENENIKKCFIHGYTDKIVEYKGKYFKNINNNIKYLNNFLIQKRQTPETITHLSQYQIYIDQSSRDNINNISLLINIDPKYIFEIGFNKYNTTNYKKNINSNLINNFSLSNLNNYLIQSNKLIIKDNDYIKLKNKIGNEINYLQKNKDNDNKLTKKEYTNIISILKNINYQKYYINILLNN